MAGQPVEPGAVHRVVRLADLAANWQPDLRWLALLEGAGDEQFVHRLQAAGLGNLGWIRSEQIQPGDVLVLQPAHHRAVILHRPSDLHHALQLTNRCNSHCLMCSQPPTKGEDSWMIQESLDVLRHIGASPPVLGFTGGEPLLLGLGLRTVLDAMRERHPATHVEVLTNGRMLADEALAAAMLQDLAGVSWLVPLYGHADFLHDFVVQAPGAFEETLAGLLALQSWKQPVQLRIVLIRPVLEVLPELCVFIGKNLPFVREVALMACEPIGFALANKDICNIDLLDWSSVLDSAVAHLRRYRVSSLFMNVPLCALPPRLHDRAHRSISDWKNVYAPGCDGCTLRHRCCGLFAWHERGWAPTLIRPYEEVMG